MTTYESTIGVRPLNDKFILVDIYDDGGQSIAFNGKQFIMTVDSTFGENDVRTKALTDKHKGIRPRWAKVVATTDVGVEHGYVLGAKVLIDTLKWSRGFQIDYKKRPKERAWRVPLDDILLIDEEGFTELDLKDMEGRKHMDSQL